MQLFTLPRTGRLPDHVHDAGVEDANQEEVYIPLEARPSCAPATSATSCAWRDGARRPEQRRRILRAQGIRFLASAACRYVPRLAVDRARRPAPIPQ